MNLFERREFKYYIPIEQVDALRQRLLANMEHDPFCLKHENKRYCVRSIYLDTRSLLFYYEKIDGLKIRKKLRIRVYDNPGDFNVSFFEIKRKIDDIVRKQRATTLIQDVPNLMNGAVIRLHDEKKKFERANLDNFIYITKRLNLEPKILVTYEREAFAGIDDPYLRVTFDFNVRSCLMDDFSGIYQEHDMISFMEDCFILELKFFGRMPLWLKSLIREFGMHKQAISKYCNSYDLWLPQIQESKENN